ncbi:MAG: DUF4296 domain-containing protein [Bacteroidales bacterium]|nr:DUF4296 domain-containing protein [Bacteroidales bacterium]
MRLRWAHIVVLSAVLAMLCGCGRRSRVIPAEKFTRIYHDMFLADQWLRDNQSARKVADTTLFFDPIFRRYGYTFEDYDRSVHYYLDRPEQYAKILDRASERLRKEGERLQKEADALTAREIELSRYRRGFVPRDFSVDSVRWSGARILWPVRQTKDSTGIAAVDPLPVVQTDDPIRGINLQRKEIKRVK